MGNILGRKLLKSIHKNIPETVFFVIGLALGILGNQLVCSGFVYGWQLIIVRTLYFVPFYALGIFYKSVLEKYDRKVPSFWYFSAVFLINLLIIWYLGRVPQYTPSWCNDFVDGPVFPIVVGFVRIALWMRIATILSPVVGRSKWVNLVADNTYSIMMNHILGFMVVKTIFATINLLGWGFEDFDWLSYKTDIWWFYKPKGLDQMLLIYVVFGIIFSIVIQKLINILKQRLRRRSAT
ncbi:hypothetical protein [Allofournierella sp. CML151]|uniref:hypothetical protein n=1 Tax=Allofournierella sp. CML151 TaxID=2998082 RepID=UPI0022EB15E2|nr:hypothetical protein [Fournierella sp. CML151]